ncbi:unnamed protein product, partial [Darwinula stevensoni]
AITSRDLSALNIGGINTLSRSAEHIYSSLHGDGGKKLGSRARKPLSLGKGPFGSISRVFARASKQRKSLEAAGTYDAIADYLSERQSWSPRSSLCASPLREDNYSEKLRLLEEAQRIPMEQWRAGTLQAWLELSLGMPQYAVIVAENVKSG